MKNYNYILLLILTLAFHISGSAQNQETSNKLLLQLNNIVFVSGEDIGFKCTYISETEHPDNILFVDICGEGYLLSSCILMSHNNHWQGHIEIPDSTQTGIYIMRAYIGDKNGNPTISSTPLTIFNRFGNNEINEVRKKNNNYQAYNYLNIDVQPSENLIKTYATKTNFSTLDTIQFSIENNLNETIGGLSFSVFKIPEENIKEPIINQKYSTHLINQNIKIYNNLTLGGKVIDRITKKPKINEMVLLSIPNTNPQINYDYTDIDGKFEFQLNEYYGSQDIIVQTQNKNDNLEIELYPLNLLAPLNIPFYISTETENHEFSKLSVSRSIMNKAYETTSSDSISVESEKYPFYGKTLKRVYPGKYIHLKDFKEIAWEILPILKYKTDEDSTYLKIWDPISKAYYNEPMLLVDGVPISNAAEINILNTEKINWVEIQPQIRCFGDLLMEGVVSIQTKNGNYTDIELPYNSIRTKIETFYYNHYNKAENSIFRNMLFWDPELNSKQKVQQVNVECSYEKGTYIALTQTFDIKGNLQRSFFHFEVQ